MKMQGIRVPMSNLGKDFMASYLRLQIATLQNVLASIESSEIYDDCYITNALNSVGKELRQIRRMYSNN